MDLLLFLVHGAPREGVVIIATLAINNFAIFLVVNIMFDYTFKASIKASSGITKRITLINSRKLRSVIRYPKFDMFGTFPNIEFNLEFLFKLPYLSIFIVN